MMCEIIIKSTTVQVPVAPGNGTMEGVVLVEALFSSPEEVTNARSEVPSARIEKLEFHRATVMTRTPLSREAHAATPK